MKDTGGGTRDTEGIAPVGQMAVAENVVGAQVVTDIWDVASRGTCDAL